MDVQTNLDSLWDRMATPVTPGMVAQGGHGAGLSEVTERWNRPAAGAATVGAEFSRMLSAHDAATDRAQPTREDQARQSAQQLVAITLVQPILQQLRNDPFKSDRFHGGRGEEIFQSQLDTILAERVTGATGFGLVDQVARRMLSRHATTGGTVNVHG